MKLFKTPKDAYEAIYKYVIENLKPNISSAGSLMGGERLGGQQILLNQDIATDEDYADAIVSLYRYYNIPARFVIGYLSNISNYDSNGIFHFWAEYYNSEQNDWIIVEPFLEDYTKTPLWKKEMKDHVALIYRSSNPYTPKLPFYVEGELTIEPVKENTNYKSNFDIELILKPYRLTDPFLLGYISLTNTGTTVIDKLEIINSKPDLSKYIDYIELGEDKKEYLKILDEILYTNNLKIKPFIKDFVKSWSQKLKDRQINNINEYSEVFNKENINILWLQEDRGE